MNQIWIKFASSTQVMAASRRLRRGGIIARVQRAPGDHGEIGCGYLLSFDLKDKTAGLSLLASGGYRYRVIQEGGGMPV